MKSSYKFTSRMKKSYLECCDKFQLIGIKSDAHLQAAHTIIEELLVVKLDDGQKEYLLTLSRLVADYEDENIDFGGKTTPSEMLGHLMESRKVSGADLWRATGIGKSTISGILSERVNISRNNAFKLGNYFGVDPVFFLRQLATA